MKASFAAFLVSACMAVTAWALAPMSRIADARRQPAPSTVRLRGVVTAFSGWKNSFFLEDGSGGISVDRDENAAVQVGNEVEVTGSIRPGLFAPIVVAERTDVIGTVALPPARISTYGDLARGQFDSRRVEVEGIVHAARSDEMWGRRILLVKLQITGGLITLHVLDFPPENPDYLVDSTVRVQGVCATAFNDRRQLTGVLLFVPAIGGIQVEQPAPEPARIPRSLIGNLLQFDPDVSSDHRVKIAGVVTYQMPGKGLYLQENGVGVLVETSQAGRFKPGTQIEATGFAAEGAYSPILKDATLRPIEIASTAPPPLLVTAPGVITEKDGFRLAPYDGRFVQLEGTIVELVPRTSRQTWFLREGKVLFQAELSAEVDGQRLEIEPGSRVRLRGICLTETDENRNPKAFRILLGSAGDLAILGAPRWTPSRSTILAVLLLLVSAYAVMSALKRRRIGQALERADPTARPIEPAVMPDHSGHHARAPAFERTSRILAVIVSTVGALVLVGWVLHIAFLQRVQSDYVDMKANTALTFVAAGIALWTLNGLGRNISGWLTTICAAFTGAMGTLTLIEYQTGRNLHIDELFFKAQASLTAAANPGRMAFSTALAFALSASALLLVRRVRFVAPAQTLAMATAVLALLNLVSYLYGIRSVYGIAVDTSMAIHTAALFLLLSAGILAYRAGDGPMKALSSSSLGGVMGRRLMPAAVLLPVALGWLRWQGQLAGLYDTAFGGALFACAHVVSFSFLVWNSAAFLNRLDLARSQAERDLAERTRQLRESEHHYRQVVESLPQMVWTCLANGKPDYFSHRWVEYTGVPQEGQLEFRSSPQVHPADRDRLLERWRAVVASGTNLDEEYRLQNAAGEYRWFRDLAVPLRDSEGAIVKWFGTSTDIDNMKTAEAQIRSFNQDLEKRVQDRTRELTSANEDLSQTRNRLQTILDSATQVAIIALDCEGVVQLFNTGAEQLLGYRASDVIGKHTPRLFLRPESYRRRVADLSKRLGRSVAEAEVFGAEAMGREPHTREDIHVRSDGALLNVDLAIAPMLDGRGNRIGTLGIASDVTERRSLKRRLTEINAELRKQTMEAQNASLAKSDFLANMSHEIRTPMNGVIGMTGLLLDTPLSAEQRDYAETVRASADALLSIINDILDFSKMEGGKLAIEPIRFDLGTTVEEVVELLAPRAAEKGLDLILEYTPNAPRRVIGDPGRIRQVLLNLAGNAIKFTKAGHVFIGIEYLEQTLPVPCFQFSVEDTGIGIPENKLAHVFDRFTQADTSTTRTYGGTGLGLAISRQLVELMGGKITVTSTLQQGSSFVFALPLPLDLIAPAKPALGISLEGARVLVVDDLALNLRVVSEQLAAREVEHACVASAHEALAVLRTAQQNGQPFHIAILDHLMPEMDGEMLGRTIKADPQLSHILLLLLTSSGQKSDRARFEAAGFSAYLVKPARSEHLLGALAALWGATQDGTPLTEIVTRHSLAERHATERGSVSEKALPLVRALIAEDNPINQKLAKRLLEKSGCRVDVASNGVEAVDMWTSVMGSSAPYDAIFMDCQMPEMDGFEATAEIRRREIIGSPCRYTPIVALTAAVMAGDREKCLAAGMDDFLSKPIQPAMLRGVLERLVWAKAEERKLRAEVDSENGAIDEPAPASHARLV